MSQTTPLGRAFKTTEGVLAIVSSAVAAAAASVHGQEHLNPKIAAVVVAVNGVALLVSRTVLKAKAITALGVDPLGYIEHELLGEAEAAPVVPPVV